MTEVSAHHRCFLPSVYFLRVKRCTSQNMSCPTLFGTQRCPRCRKSPMPLHLRREDLTNLAGDSTGQNIMLRWRAARCIWDISRGILVSGLGSGGILEFKGLGGLNIKSKSNSLGLQGRASRARPVRA